MKQCNICNFSCKNNIGTYVGKNAKVLFLFESPTFQSDVDGRILSGPVMDLFSKYLEKYQISLDDIAITYMVHCFPGNPQKDNFKLTNIPVLKKYYENEAVRLIHQELMSDPEYNHYSHGCRRTES